MWTDNFRKWFRSFRNKDSEGSFRAENNGEQSFQPLRSQDEANVDADGVTQAYTENFSQRITVPLQESDVFFHRPDETGVAAARAYFDEDKTVVVDGDTQGNLISPAAGFEARANTASEEETIIVSDRQHPVAEDALEKSLTQPAGQAEREHSSQSDATPVGINGAGAAFEGVEAPGGENDQGFKSAGEAPAAHDVQADPVSVPASVAESLSEVANEASAADVADSAVHIPDLSDSEQKQLEWMRQLREVGGKNPLLHFEDSARTRIDLSRTHPGGLAQFITGQRILLSSLIRDDLALRHARLAAGRVTDKGTEMRNMRGLETVHLGVGIANWSFQGKRFCAPVLLRPLAIRRFGRDFELKLKKTVSVNTDFTRALYEQFGLRIHPETLLELSGTEGVFKPQPVIERIRQVTAEIDGFTVHPRLVVSSFQSVAESLIEYVEATQHPSLVVQAASGNHEAQKQLKDSYHPVDTVPFSQRAIQADRLIYDADSEQEDIITQILHGHSLLVRTFPGTGGTQTAVNAAAELARKGKRVLIVSATRATIEGITHRLSRVHLSGLLAHVPALRRCIVEAIRRNENPVRLPSPDIDTALTRVRSVLSEYHKTLHEKDERLQVSPHEALRELAKLASLENSPQTAVRFTDRTLFDLALDRDEVKRALVELARLGQFDFGPEDSPWYGASFDSSEEAKQAFQRAVALAEIKLPRLKVLTDQLHEQTQLRPCQTLSELGTYLQLLEGVRKSLDMFYPEVYDRSLTEVIAAHAPRHDGDMTSANRRRLKKLAKEYVRPGQHVQDMYTALTEVQQQRLLWQRYCAVVGVQPEVPGGIADLVTLYADILSDLNYLDGALQIQHEDDKMRNMSFANLQVFANSLAEESEILKTIHERTSLLERIRSLGLQAFLDDLSARHVPVELVELELEQAWWQSALEYLLREKSALLSANMSIVDRLESDFKLVDDAHIAGNSAILANELAESWKLAVRDFPQEAKELRRVLRYVEERGRPLSAADLYRAAPHLIDALLPVWAVSPYEIAALPRSLRFDCVFILDCASITAAEGLAALQTAEQVVAFGDPVIQRPRSFDISVSAQLAAQESGDYGESLYEVLERVLPTLQLTKSYRAGATDLVEIINERFYNGQIQSLPWAGNYFNRTSIVREFVREGQGVADLQTGLVESTDAEVERVVWLVLEHAREHPNESLMVVTASRKHAVRVRQAVYKAFAKFPENRSFLLVDHSEPFTVVTVEESAALSRDRVIFSLGYGRTAQGQPRRTMNFLQGDEGRRLVAVAMTRARRAMTIVSCFQPEDIAKRYRTGGVAELVNILDGTRSESESSEIVFERDLMLVDLADRLVRLGLVVSLGYGKTQLASESIPLVASYENRAIAIDLDTNTADEDLRSSLRLRPSLLRRLGWQYYRIQSFDLFADPHRVALAIARMVGFDPEASRSDSVVEALEGSEGSRVSEGFEGSRVSEGSEACELEAVSTPSSDAHADVSPVDAEANSGSQGVAEQVSVSENASAVSETSGTDSSEDSRDK